MAGFIRRFPYVPGNEVLSAIEGVAILDLPPAGSIEGSNTGIACCVGEFADMTYACAVDGTGAVTEDVRPQQVLTAGDLLNDFGGWDETLGDFADSEGNGFVALRSKVFAGLVLAPVFLASNYGFRFWRELPLCTSTTSAIPVVPVEGAQVAAGREFRSASGGRVRLGKRVVFTALDTITTGVGGATTAAAAAATQNFTVAGADFSAIVRPDGGIGIKKGDVIVIGNNNIGARQPLAGGGGIGAGTYRVAADAGSGSPTVLTLEQMDGTNFFFVNAATIPYRIHVSSDADSAPVFVVGVTTPGGYKASEAGGYSVPVRPLTNFAGAAVDGTWTANSALTPLSVPTALTGSTADPLSGLTGRTHISGAAAFTQNVQAPNAASHASIDTLYQSALARTISDLAPLAEITIIWCARTSATIRSELKSNALAASKVSKGRVAVVAPDLDTVTTANAVSDSSPGVGATRDERVTYTWPGVQISVPEAVNTRISTADGLTTIDGILDVRMDGFLASILSNLNPELNPGQAAEPVPSLMAAVRGVQRGVSRLELNDYILLKSRGVAAVRMDRTSGPIIQSGVTSSLTSGQKNINRRRFADFIQDSAAARLVQYSKLPITNRNKDSMLGELVDFLESLLSTDNPAAQRIESYSVDPKSGNSKETLAANIYVLIAKVKMLATSDTIVLQTDVGNNVVTAIAS